MTTFVNNAAYEIPGFYIGVLEANISMVVEATYQYTGVDVSAATGAGLVGPGALVPPASAGVAILGILQNNPQLAEAGQVMTSGVTKAVAGGTFAIGAILAVNSSGQLVAATSGQYGVAKALQAGVSGTIVSVFLFGYGKQ
jgi:hypothetical protein